MLWFSLLELAKGRLKIKYKVFRRPFINHLPNRTGFPFTLAQIPPSSPHRDNFLFSTALLMSAIYSTRFISVLADWIR